MVVKSWLCLLLYVMVYLDGGTASVFPCLEGVGGCEGANRFDDGRELRFGSICSLWVATEYVSLFSITLTPIAAVNQCS